MSSWAILRNNLVANMLADIGLYLSLILASRLARQNSVIVILYLHFFIERIVILYCQINNLCLRV